MTKPSRDNSNDALPRDVDTLAEMVRELLHSLQQERQKVKELEGAMDQLIRQYHSPKRERYVDPDQITICWGEDDLDPDSEGNGDSDEQDEETPAGQSQRRNRKRGGRRPFGDNLKQVRKEHLLEDSQKQCGKCGSLLDLRMIKGAERIGYRPGEYFVTEHYQQTGFCNGCDECVTKASKPPQMIPKGMADASMLAHVITSKQGDHLPHYRQEEISLRHGYFLPRSTQADWLKQTAWTAVILYCWMAKWILRGKVIGTDETRAPVLEPGSGQVQTGHMWIYCGQQEVCPYLIYDYTRTKEGIGPRTFLEGYEGYLQADAASVFDKLFHSGKVWEVACGAHMRRYFYKAKEESKLAHIPLAYFRRLYKIERDLKSLDEDQRRAYRQEYSLPLLSELKIWIDEQAERALPKSDLGAALRYARNHWEAFLRYCDQGWLIIDNTRSERALRAIAVGRRNWLFYGNDGGGRTGAILTSLVASAKTNRVSPFAYLQDVFEQLPAIREAECLLPLLRSACEQVEFPDGTRPRMVSLEAPIDYLRILKDYPRLLTEQLLHRPLDSSVAEQLDALLPDRWHQAHPEHHLPINRDRRTRLVGAA